MQFIGLTRFSVLAGGGLKETHKLSYAERASLMFREARLHNRMRLFRSFVVPELRVMTKAHRDFRHIVFISPELPLMWKLRLQKSLIGVRSKVVEVGANDNLHERMRASVAKLAKGRAVFTFRVDDDDALPHGYLHAVLGASRDWTDYKAVSFDEGYFIKRMSSGRFIVERRNIPYIAIGLGLFAPAGAEARTIFCLGNHMKIARKVDVHHFDNPPWIRTVHPTNDSRLKMTEGQTLSQREAIELIAREAPVLEPSRALAALKG
jgi:hypothetical protein